MDLTLPTLFQDIEILVAVLVCVLLSAFLLDKLGENFGIKGMIVTVVVAIIGVVIGAFLGDRVNPDFGSHIFGLIGGTIGLSVAYLGSKAFHPYRRNNKPEAEDHQENANEKP